MRTLLSGARIITPDDEFEGGVLVENGRIAAVERAPVDGGGADEIDLRGFRLAPGFIDVHVHGGGGYSLCTKDASEIVDYRTWAASTGVTSLLATVCAANIGEGAAFLKAAAAGARAEGAGSKILGINLEGPFVSGERRGALPRTWATAPDFGTWERLRDAAAGQLRMMTIAPEGQGASEVMTAALASGVRVSVGHTDATFEVAKSAFEAGASHITHAFNAMRPWHHREPGPLGAALDCPDVTVELIADGVHLHPSTVRLLISAFGPERIALVTDAVAPAGLASGSFRMGQDEARLRDGRMELPDGTIAGSAATMDALVRNVVDWGIAGLTEAIRMASAVPARIAGVADRKGRIARGFDADLVVLDADMRVVKTFTGGRESYSR